MIKKTQKYDELNEEKLRIEKSLMEQLRGYQQRLSEK